MVVYLTPASDDVAMADIDRLKAVKNEQVLSIMIRLGDGATVQEAVHQLSRPSCKALLMPDDFRRHDEMIEHVKACAHHMGLPVMPVSRYLLTKTATSPGAKHPGSANPIHAGAGGGLVARA